MFKVENLHFSSKSNFSKIEGDGDKQFTDLFQRIQIYKKRLLNVTEQEKSSILLGSVIDYNLLEKICYIHPFALHPTIFEITRCIHKVNTKFVLKCRGNYRKLEMISTIWHIYTFPKLS